MQHRLRRLSRLGRQRLTSLSLQVILTILVGSMLAIPALAQSSTFPAERGFEEVVVRGSDLAAFLGQSSSRIHLYRYDAGSGSFVPIAFQVDRFTTILLNDFCNEDLINSPIPGENCDVGPVFDDNGQPVSGDLGADDQIVFLAKDAGDRAPTTAWVGGNVYEKRYEIRVDDVRLVNGEPVKFGQGWVYAFLWQEDHPYEGPWYMSWTQGVLGRTGDHDETACIASPVDPFPVRAQTACGYAEADVSELPAGWATYRAHFLGNWILNRLEVRAGGASEILDRQKMRITGPNPETEEMWSTVGCAIHHGTKAGPVRVLYYTQGAASGPGTTLLVEMYPTHMRQHVNLRVHDGLPDLQMRMDLLSSTAGSRVYVNSKRGENNALVAADEVDGTPPSEAFGQPDDWTELATGAGRVFDFFRETVPYGVPRSYQYVDSSALNTPPEFEDGAWGNFGWKWTGPTPDKQERRCAADPDGDEPFRAEFDRTLYFRVGGTDPGTDGDLLATFWENPLREVIEEQNRSYPVPEPPPCPICHPDPGLVFLENGRYVDLSPQVPAGTDCGTDVTGFSVYRASGLGDFAYLGTVAVGGTFRDASVMRDHTYRYVVRAVNANGDEGPASQEVSVLVTDHVAPAAPANVVAEAWDGALHLSWDAVSAWDLRGYHVYLATQSGGPYTRVTGDPVPVGTEEWTVTGLTNGQAYWAVVRALDWGGNESVNSSEVSGTPGP